jgi:integrase
VQANHALSAISQVTQFYSNRARGYNPPGLKGLKRKIQSRDRILTKDEIKAVWNTGDRLMQFLLLTCARRTEAGAMRWREIVGTDWILPKERNMKTGLDCVRPLSKAAQAVLGPRGDDDDLVFGNRGYTLLKRKIDLMSGVKNWRFHDLRRTARTLLSEAGISPDHAERCLGHVIGGIRGVYDRFEYLSEKRHAFEALAKQIDLIVNPPAKGSNVHQLKRKQARS